MFCSSTLLFLICVKSLSEHFFSSLRLLLIMKEEVESIYIVGWFFYDFFKTSIIYLISFRRRISVSSLIEATAS